MLIQAKYIVKSGEIMKDLVLAVDCGTQSIRGIVFDHQGHMLVKEQVYFEPYFSKEPGYAEQNPEVFWEALCEVTQKLILEAPEVMAAVTALTVTTQRDTCVLIDKTGQVLRPAISWADQRKISKAKPFSTMHRIVFRIIGMTKTVTLLSRNFKGHWILEHEPEIWRKTYKYLQLSTFFNYRLTGEIKDSMASQIGHIPFSYKNFRWEKKGSLKHDVFQIEDDKLYDLVPPTQLLGQLSQEASLATGLKKGLRVIASGSDKGCETLGVGCIDDSCGAISLGSQASIQTTSKRYYETLAFIPPFPAVIPKHYNPEIQIYRGYWMISWFKKEFAQKEVRMAHEMGITPEELLNQELANVPPGAEGLVLQPYWGAGLKMPEARGAIVGFSDAHTRVHIYRAIIEGIAFALYEGLQKIEKKSKVPIQRLMLSGGGSQSDVICQITADIFKRPVYRVQTSETSALGASIAAYVGIGVFKSFEEGIKAMVHDSEAFTPQVEAVKVYDRLYEKVYKRLYKRIKPLYKHLNA